MEKTYQIRTLEIEYSIGVEDLDLDDEKDYTESELEDLVEEFKQSLSLPQEIELEVTCSDEDELDEMIGDAISEITGWLVEYFDYEVLN